MIGRSRLVGLLTLVVVLVALQLTASTAKYVSSGADLPDADDVKCAKIRAFFKKCVSVGISHASNGEPTSEALAFVKDLEEGEAKRKRLKRMAACKEAYNILHVGECSAQARAAATTNESGYKEASSGYSAYSSGAATTTGAAAAAPRPTASEERQLASIERRARRARILRDVDKRRRARNRAKENSRKQIEEGLGRFRAMGRQLQSKRRAARDKRFERESKEREKRAKLVSAASRALAQSTVTDAKKLARNLVRKYLREVSSGKTAVLGLSPSLFDKFMLPGYRYYNVVLLISSKGSVERCFACQKLHAAFDTIAESALPYLKKKLEEIAEKSLSKSPLKPFLPKSLVPWVDETLLSSTQAASNYGDFPIVFANVDSETYYDFFASNKIQMVPQILVLPASATPTDIPMKRFMSSQPSSHFHRVGALEDLEAPSMRKFIARVLQVDEVTLSPVTEKSEGDESSVAATRQEEYKVDPNAPFMTRVKQHLLRFAMTQPVHVLVGVSMGAASVIGLLIVYASDVCLRLLRSLKWPVAIFAIASYLFNVGGGMFNRLSNTSFGPHHLQKFQWSTYRDAFLNPVSWFSHGFRSQYALETGAVAFYYFAIALILLILRAVAMAHEFPTTSHPTVRNAQEEVEEEEEQQQQVKGGSEDKSDSAAVGKVALLKKLTDNAICNNIVFNTVYTIVVGIIFPLVCFYLAIQLYFIVVKVFVHKSGGYGEVSFGYRLVAEKINHVLRTLRIPVQVPANLI